MDIKSETHEVVSLSVCNPLMFMVQPRFATVAASRWSLREEAWCGPIPRPPARVLRHGQQAHRRRQPARDVHRMNP